MAVVTRPLPRPFADIVIIGSTCKGRIWASDAQLPGSQGQFFAFDLKECRRLAHLDIPPSGYHAALRCAERYLEGDNQGARDALAEAQAIQGPAAPLLLMAAVLHGLSGNQVLATRCLRAVVSDWPETPAGALAQRWLEGQRAGGTPQLPFPSAIRPRIHLQPGTDWVDRAARVGI